MARYYGVQGGSGGGDTGVAQHLTFREQSGPSSYPTGGFEIDLSATYSELKKISLVVKKGSRGSLPACDYHVTYDSPMAGKATVKIMRKRFDQVSAVGNITNQPAGVTVQATSGVASAAEAAHTHAMNHQHDATSAAPTQAGGQVLLDTLGANTELHTHFATIGSGDTLATGAGGSHTHADNSVYQHTHAATHAATDLASTELANATNLSTTVWYLKAIGQSL